MVAFTDEAEYGLPSRAYMQGVLAHQDGFHKLSNPYLNPKSRNHSSWDMGYEDSAGKIYDNAEGFDTQECA